MPPVILAENLSKIYRLGEVSTGALAHDVNRAWYKLRGKDDPYLKVGETNDRTQKGGEYIWALKDVNFEVAQGEVLGVIGRNGAGKSTLLKLLSRTTQPTTGSIKIKGRVASLLEVGTGFHPELSGRDNVFLNGSILGMTKREIRSKFEEIVAFAGVEKYIDTPVKRYSSGMYVRLAFAVAAHLDPDILIVDEVLAVGDAEFQKKAIGKMKSVSEGEGRTVLFVSHNLLAINDLCNRALLLANGRLVENGNTADVIRKYASKLKITSFKEYNEGPLRSIKVIQENGILIFEGEFNSDEMLDIPNLGVVVYDHFGAPVYGTNTYQQNAELAEYHRGTIRFEIKHPKLKNGLYTASIWFGNASKNLMHDQHALSFEVAEYKNIRNVDTGFIGNVIPEVNIIIDEIG